MVTNEDDLILLGAFGNLEEFLTNRYTGWEGTRQFKGTRHRLVRMYNELCWPASKIEEELDKAFKSTFKDGYDEALVEPDISVYTLCPHHLLPVHMKVTIGYIPDKKVLGLSKFVRIADIMGRRPVIQEEYSRELTEVIHKRLEPKGVAVYIVGIHNCMAARGVKQRIPTITSKLTGPFKDDGKTRAEFYAIARGKR